MLKFIAFGTVLKGVTFRRQLSHKDSTLIGGIVVIINGQVQPPLALSLALLLSAQGQYSKKAPTRCWHLCIELPSLQNGGEIHSAHYTFLKKKDE